ncbi:hypothetical protein [Nocardioides mesophilus]|uniref:Uncharacterized protein n=1 Tax=Nocardioides mesophilus TaxID=433659 RepID=A0A7G9R9L3_9ACTN|nr:hypothetical protein [Nocardioides mesophilus]QNN52288.1 hypothetical protein H9L09_17650 [Nocardioides mesophilus]
MAMVATRTGRGVVAEAGGRRRAEKAKRPSRLPQLGGLSLGAVAAGVAWYFLVSAAIDFGQLARGGNALAWAFTGAATIGATLCLLLVFVLLARILVALGLISEYRPRRSTGRRAAR